MAAPTPITEELKKNILEDYKAGMIYTDLIAKHHIGFTKLKQILNLPRGKRGEKRVHYDKQAVINDYREGMPVKMILEKHKIKSYSNVYAIVSSEKKRTKDSKKVWKRKVRVMTDPTCPIILRLRVKYRNYEVSLIGQSGLTGSLETYYNVKPKERYCPTY